MQPSVRRTLFYWATQLIAWTAYVVLFGLGLYLNDQYSAGQGYALLLTLCIGVSVSHVLRNVIRRKRLTEGTLGTALPRMALSAVGLGFVAALLQAVLHDLLFPYATPMLSGQFSALYEQFIAWVIMLLVWGVCYFAYQWFLRGRKEEIRNLRLESANRDGQLATLRAQLNPHFMFNALNGIRALIDEDPARAKQAITQLSAILRNAMATVKRRTVPLGEELDIVKDYLALERMRFEERLRTRFDIDPTLERETVPPMLLQTLVENAVRHGIAKLTQGGEVNISVQRGDHGMIVRVSNTGTYVEGKVNGSGIGLSGTRKRLAMIYGPEATLRIHNQAGMVVTEVDIPYSANDPSRPNEL
ncbi:MAG: histidine kinase [Flavobacteriales bacterium]|nr:histidine kinase [Flavobacteriales bacterium]